MKLSQLVVLIISIFSLTLASGCTSSQTEGDQANAELADESLEMAEAIDNNDDLAMDFDGGDDSFGDLSGDVAAADAPTDSGSSDDFADSSELALSDETAPSDMAATDSAVGADDLTENGFADAGSGEAPLDDLAPDFGAPSEDTALADNDMDSAPDSTSDFDSGDSDMAASTPEPSYADNDSDISTGSSVDYASDTGSTGGVIPLKKMVSVPYMHGKKPVNGLYMAREGDTVESISQKIFGGNRVDELCAINSYNCSRGIKVGDKYYYNSPQRPNDTESMKTFYEDAGVPAQTYVTQEGDNLRTLGKTLLGHDRGWMELWATNADIESKDELPAGVALRYWPSGGVSMPTMAQNEPPQAPDLPAAPQEMPPPPAMDDMALNEIPEVPQDAAPMMEPADDFAQNDAGMDAAMGSIEPPPPPPPPPPPMDRGGGMDMASDDGQFEDPNQTMALGVGAILLLAGVLLFVAIRKRRARRPVDFNTSTQTQIE